MTNQKQSDLKQIFHMFLAEFLDESVVIYRDSLLTKTMILEKQAGSINAFAHDVGDFIFKKQDKCKNLKKDKDVILEKTTDFFKQYCGFVRSIKIDDEFENIFLSKQYEELATQIQDLNGNYGNALFELIENKQTKLKDLEKLTKSLNYSDEKKEQEINEFLANYRDPKNAGIMDYATKMLKGPLIEVNKIVSTIPKAALMVHEALMKCDEAGKHDAKNMFNMLVEGSLGTGGYFEAMIRLNNAVIQTIGKSLALSSADKYQNSIIQDQVIAVVVNPQAQKNMDQKTIPANAKILTVQEKQEEYDKKYAECAKKGHASKTCEVELEVVEKAFYRKSHDTKYEKFIKESADKQLKNLARFKKFDEDDKLEQCKDNNIVKFFSENSLKSFESSTSVSGNYLMYGASAAASIEDSTQSKDSSCLSFAGVHSIPIRHPWFEKDIYALDFSATNNGVSLDIAHFNYYDHKDFLLDRCVVPKAVIVGTGMRAHFKQDILKKYDFSSQVNAEVNTLLFNVKAETKNGYSHYDQKTGGFDIYEPDLVVVLGYELENLCDKLQPSYLNGECPNLHYGDEL